MDLKVLLEQDEDGWIVASVPALKGCHSQGRTREEALKNIREAIQGWLIVAQEDRLPPSKTPPNVEITAIAV